ncbi:restriction endonuclease subunit S [Rhodovulum sulfidophilum]|uniref:restriction endonuclease subunit S n=1 Tax=Rhodovulum sulfidophilum TaxID=35806 RepID=UPI001389AC85|nr:restriction endonuclease subunit S [Rhodovulum sulfidophilum]NDK35495.1 hypothetical protein [Rhodovulum sulfidophilum]
MNAERLLDVYEQISEAPDAIARLRRFVLDLAVRGRLVDAISAEGTGADLADRIAADKAEKEKAGLIKPAKAPKGVTRETVLEIPAHWQPLLMVDILDELQTGPFGSSLKKSDYAVGGVPVINPASIVNEAIRPVAEMAVGAKTLERLASFKLQQGDIVMARRGEMGRCALVGEADAGWLCGTGSLILRPSKLLFAKYLVLLIGSPYSRNYLAGSAVGATMQNLNQNILLSMPIGLPPEPEQQRIVAKVDELMALCDRLEQARKTREEVRDKLTAASLARLTAPDTTAQAEPAKVGTGFASGYATTEDNFPTHAAFALEALPALTTRPDQIKTLRQTILNLAVRGKLVKQDPADIPALHALSALQSEKAYLIESGKLRAVKSNDPEIIDTDLPASWTLVAPEQLSAAVSNALTIGPFGSNLTKSDYRENGVPLTFVADVTSDFSIPTTKFVTKEKARELKSHGVTGGDLVITKMGDPPGTPAIYPAGRPAGIITADCIKWTLAPQLIDVHFAKLAVASDIVRVQIVDITKGGAHQKVSLKRFRSIAIPLPPLAEQHRIVAKVDALMALCDRLETALTTTDTTRTRLLEALLHEALEPADRAKEAAE